MGVNGLWTVVQPCARPTNLATLNRKRLAVDASIWIYQFLKAVRDKEGNALRNSHVVGFFRRICKLLWFGIQPVFVFDGGAPALKRQTITNRKRRREGRREDAVRTAGKLLAVQIQRKAEEESEKQRRRAELEKEGRAAVEDPSEKLPSADQLIYVDEIGMSQAERQRSRKLYKQDAYHLPELETSIAGMGKPEDPRIMSVEELEEYARQFHSGEDINLYDFSKIDFEGEFFKSLPAADRYNILNAARIRSRLRMGLSKEQLDDMFPDRMAFSRFQIERVKERNHLTQRLMKEAGMTGTDLTLGGGGRIAGEKDREYILVKNEGAEGGWALGVVSKDRDRGEIHKPIDVDALDFQYQAKQDDDDEWEDEEDFEDVPIEGLNRLPKIDPATRDIARRRQQFYESRMQGGQGGDFLDDAEEDDSLFVQDQRHTIDSLFEAQEGDILQNDEEEDLNRAIAMSLKTQHNVSASNPPADDEEEAEFEDVSVPEWTQKAVEPTKPVTSASGSIIAHVVNKRANAAVPKRRRSDASSDSDVDLRAALSAARKKKKTDAPKPRAAAPTISNIKNPFGGPLPFEKLDWKSSIFAKKPENPKPKDVNNDDGGGGFILEEPDDELAGGFQSEKDGQEEAADGPRPLPPWMMQSETDIRDSLKAQLEREKEINEDDRQATLAEERRQQKEEVIQIDSSDDSDVEFIDAPLPKPQEIPNASQRSRLSPATLTKVSPPLPNPEIMQDDIVPTPAPNKTQDNVDTVEEHVPQADRLQSAALPNSPTPEPDFEDVELQPSSKLDAAASESPEPILEDVVAPTTEPPVSGTVANETDDALFANDDESDEFSDPEDEELLAQMAEEAEEHARFASQMNNKSERENQEAYERELKALRTQQKKDRRDADEVTQIMVTECQALLRLFGIPYITAPMEAEAQCAELVRLGLVDGIVTDDSDTFLFGGTRVYKNMFNSNKYVECYLGTDIEKDLSLSREQLICLAHLLGSDYTEGLPGVGPVTAVEILSEFPGKEGLAAFRDWWQDVQMNSRPKEADATSPFRKKFRKSQASKLFLPLGFPSPPVFDAYLHPEVDSESVPFQWGVPDVEGLRQFLMATIGWSQERTDEVLVPVIRDINRREAEGTQANITRYFEGGVGVGAREAFAPRLRGPGGSKRMAQAVDRLRANNAAVGDVVVVPEGEVEEQGEGGASASSRRRNVRRNRDDDDDDDDFVDDGAGAQEGGDSSRKRAKGKRKGKAKAKASV